MKNNLAKLFAVSSFIAGGSLMAAMPASALDITLGDGDFININTYGARFTGEPIDFTGTPFDPPLGLENADGAVITNVEFDTDPTLVQDFVGNGGFATADVISTNVDELLGIGDGTGIASIKSFDIIDQVLVSGNFTILTPGGPDLDFSDGVVSNVFGVDAGFGAFIEIDTDGGAPDLQFFLTEFTTEQTDSLLNNDAEIGVGFEGEGFWVAANGDLLGTASFSTTIPANGTPTVLGTGVVSTDVQVDIPEPSSLVSLIGLGLLGSAFALKKRSKVA